MAAPVDIRYNVAVRALCEFTAKVGDLDLRSTPSPTSQQGIAGHALVTARRGKTYEREVSLEGVFEYLCVRGRADGYDPERNRLEEIKTFRGDLRRMPGNHRQLHWAQVETYGHLLCQQRSFADIELALVYFDIGSSRETLLLKTFRAADLQSLFELRCRAFMVWAESEMAHRAARNCALDALTFPYPDFRGGQRQLAEAVYKAASMQRCLVAEAPTGIGKTLGTLFPLLKASSTQNLDKIFFLAAKTTGRSLALATLARFHDSTSAEPLRVLELVARDKACIYLDKACHGDSCPLAKGFYDRLPAARRAALQAGWMDQAAVRRAALAEQICPYYLAQELVRWCDIAVGDYNYYFDGRAILYSLSEANKWRTAVLIDEAHNLIERSRSMYSAMLDQTVLKVLKRNAPSELKASLSHLDRSWCMLYNKERAPYRTELKVPEKFLAYLQEAISAITDYLTGNPDQASPQLQNFYFEAMHFSRTAELLDHHSIFDITQIPKSGIFKGETTRLCLRNVIPAPFLRARFAGTVTTVLFSATLTPFRFYGEMLGIPVSAPTFIIESPFTAQQLDVFIADHVSTRLLDRVHSLQPIVELIAAQFAQAPGNYLAFFSSFDYLQQVADLLNAYHPEIPVWRQARGMDEAARDSFLQRFDVDGRGVGFAVLGGAFAEGIDLPGRRLLGAFIATLGLPQTNPVNEQIRTQLDATLGNGYEYAYLYPGLQKVVQAAGRVIRTPEDRGVVYLIDDRFTRTEVIKLLPRWWQVQRPTSSTL